MTEIDYETALERVGGDRELLAELAAMFEEDYPRLLNEARAGLRAGEMEAVCSGAHQLKGLLAQFSAGRARDAALMLETAGRAGDVKAAGEALAHLEWLMDKVQPELHAMSLGG